MPEHDFSLGPQTRPGRVSLAVGDLERMRRFYEEAIGLDVLGSHGASSAGAVLGACDGTPLVELVPSPGAVPRPPRTTGLFHLAILVPGRPELAGAVARLTDFGWRLSGASDHLVSEAVYLDDPEGNGIEIYRDRPRAEWRYAGGGLRMATLPLDLRALMRELPDGDARREPPPGVRIGHVHLNVPSLDESEAFYAGLLGFEVMVRGYAGALFVAAGGYHHHIGLNTWAGEGAPPPPPGALGLRSFELVVPGEDELDRLVQRLSAAGIEVERRQDGFHVEDPAGIGIVLTA